MRARAHHRKQAILPLGLLAVSLAWIGAVEAVTAQVRDSTNDQSEPRPSLTPGSSEAPTGELKLTGSNVYELTLDGPGGRRVVEVSPEGVVRLPVGAYHSVQARLRQGDRQAQANIAGPLSIRADRTATLTIGGPLTNSVAVSRSGAFLRMDYRLAGAGGHTYTLLPQDRSRPPEFGVYRGDRRIASGKFEFG